MGEATRRSAEFGCPEPGCPKIETWETVTLDVVFPRHAKVDGNGPCPGGGAPARVLAAPGWFD